MENSSPHDVGSRLVQTSWQGPDETELKELGQISVLQQELGSKSRYTVGRHFPAF